jgi:hypothetical protein
MIRRYPGVSHFSHSAPAHERNQNKKIVATKSTKANTLFCTKAKTLLSLLPFNSLLNLLFPSW